jgi:hypothetical protein
MEVFRLKKSRILFLSLFFMFSASIGVLAANGMEKIEAYLRSDFQVFVDGKKVDVGPVLIYKDRSYLPLARIGPMVGAEVNWKAENKGIYINQRYAGQPQQELDDDLVYDEINLYQPAAYTVSYLGGEYRLLANTTYDYRMYYREKDLNRMGVNTKGLRKAEEKFTKELYIDTEEVAPLWKEQPLLTPAYEFAVSGERDEARIKVVKEFVESIPLTEAIMDPDSTYENPYDHPYNYYTPVVYAVDALPDYEYNILVSFDGRYNWYKLKLKQYDSEKWYQSGYNKISQEMYLH